MANFIPSGYCGVRRESLVKRQPEINARCSSFIKIGFSPELFTINNLHNYGYTESQFLKLISPFSSIVDLSTLRYIFKEAREWLYHDPSATPPDEFCDFINCIKWMKSYLSAMKKKDISKDDVALAGMLVASAAPLMQERRRIRSELNELKKRQMELERKYANINAELKLKLGPIYGYEEPSETELRIESYLVYEEDCRSRGITAMPKLVAMACANLVDMFGGIAKERHLIKFLNDPGRKELIETYLKDLFAFGADIF